MKSYYYLKKLIKGAKENKEKNVVMKGLDLRSKEVKSYYYLKKLVKGEKENKEKNVRSCDYLKKLIKGRKEH